MLVANADQRDQACARLSRDGYEVLGFADCENAVAWLEEETPTIAVIDGDLMPGCSGVLNVLGERGVLLV
ncbi:hypothetical protein [Methylobacterium thuringiense]|uniref:hypothetical protein n=1 Tax=Methylobacterium thuringiense TaxID=1003091 RepID=UPI0011C77082|nr:hypothetical protein [Methylobacterium thuringiense]